MCDIILSKKKEEVLFMAERILIVEDERHLNDLLRMELVLQRTTRQRMCPTRKLPLLTVQP